MTGARPASVPPGARYPTWNDHERTSVTVADRFVRFTETGEVIEVPRPRAVTVVGARVADLPVPRLPSDECPCGGCAAPVWLARDAPALRSFVAAGAPVRCTVCALDAGMTLERMVTTAATVDQAGPLVGPHVVSALSARQDGCVNSRPVSRRRRAP